MPPINLFKRRVAVSTEASKATAPLSVKVDDSFMSTSIASTRTEATAQTDFSDETRQDFQRRSTDLAFSDDEDDDWRNDFLSPGSAISKDLEVRRKVKAPLSPVASGDSSELQEHSSAPSPVGSDAESEPTSSEPSTEKSPGHVRRASADSARPQTVRRHHRHRSMTSVAVLETPPRSHRRSNTLSPTGSKPPTHRRSSSTASQKSSHSPLSTSLSLESLYATLEMRAQRFGRRHFTVGQTFNLIGNYHFRQREHEKAIAAYEEALKCKEGCAEPRDSDHIASAYGNIGKVYWNTGDMKRSVKCMEKALELRKDSEVSQGTDPEKSLSIAASYHQLGLALSLNQQYAQALDALKHALRIREERLGRKSADGARTLDAIGKVHLFRGKPDDALRSHQEAYAIYIELAGEHPPTVTASLSNIAAAHVARKDFKEAIFTYLSVRNTQLMEIQKASKEARPNLQRLSMEAGETSKMLVDLFTKTRSYHNAQRAVDETLGMYQQAGLKENHPTMLALKESVKVLQKAMLQTSQSS